MRPLISPVDYAVRLEARKGERVVDPPTAAFCGVFLGPVVLRWF